ncbi:hypothetical protein F980_00055, partial [Acinetobacter lwoffii NIPH 715]
MAYLLIVEHEELIEQPKRACLGCFVKIKHCFKRKIFLVSYNVYYVNFRKNLKLSIKE